MRTGTLGLAPLSRSPHQPYMPALHACLTWSLIGCGHPLIAVALALSCGLQTMVLRWAGCHRLWPIGLVLCRLWISFADGMPVVAFNGKGCRCLVMGAVVAAVRVMRAMNVQ